MTLEINLTKDLEEVNRKIEEEIIKKGHDPKTYYHE